MMPVLSRRHAYLFVMVPGTACTAIARGVLIPYLAGEYFPPSHVFDREGTFIMHAKHATLRQLTHHALLSEGEAAGLFKFATVRNPFDVTVTKYERCRTVYKAYYEEFSRDPEAVGKRVPELMNPQKVKDIRLAVEHSFSEWVQHHFQTNDLRPRLRRPRRRYRTPFSRYGRYVDGVDFIMRFERLQEDFNEVVRHIGVNDPIEIPKINITRSKERHYREYYTPRARAIVERVYAPDLERFGYSF
jgi:hypothetical protein